MVLSEGIEVELGALPARADLEDWWRDLEARSDASFFLSWPWIGTWLDQVSTAPDLLVAKHQGQIVGLGLIGAPQMRAHKFFTSTARHLHETGSADEDVLTIEYNGFLTDRSCHRAVLQACVSAIFSLEAEEFIWRFVHEQIIADLEGALRPYRILDRTPSYQVNLGALRESNNDYLSFLSSNTRGQINKALRLYEGKGPVTLTSASTVDEGRQFFAEAGVLHQERWEGKGKDGAYAQPFFRAFHEALIDAAKPGEGVDILKIASGDEVIGYLYNFLHRGTAYFYFSGFDYEDDNRLKPGLVCHALAAQHYLDRGFDVYDFMAGEAQYKASLGEPGPDLVSLTFQKPKLKFQVENAMRAIKQTFSNQ